MSLCIECSVDETMKDDYLCARCRMHLDPSEWEDRARCQMSVAKWLIERARIYYGYEILFPEDTAWAWIKIFDDPGLAHPDKQNGDYFSSGEMLRQWEERMRLPVYVAWKATGYIYRIESDGAVSDEPLYVYKP